MGFLFKQHGRVKKHLKESDLVRDSIQELRQLEDDNFILKINCQPTESNICGSPTTSTPQPTVIALCWSSDDFYQNSNDLTGTLTVITQCSEQLVRVPSPHYGNGRWSSNEFTGITVMVARVPGTGWRSERQHKGCCSLKTKYGAHKLFVEMSE
ncbi:hypothetical protein LguiA_003422 [Lonicera macranthoides]